MRLPSIRPDKYMTAHGRSCGTTRYFRKRRCTVPCTFRSRTPNSNRSLRAFYIRSARYNRVRYKDLLLFRSDTNIEKNRECSNIWHSDDTDFECIRRHPCSPSASSRNRFRIYSQKYIFIGTQKKKKKPNQIGGFKYLHLLPMQIWLASQSESDVQPCLQIPSTQTSPVKQLLAVKQTFSHLLLEHLSPSAQSMLLKHTTLHTFPLHS